MISNYPLYLKVGKKCTKISKHRGGKCTKISKPIQRVREERTKQEETLSRGLEEGPVLSAGRSVLVGSGCVEQLSGGAGVRHHK